MRALRPVLPLLLTAGLLLTGCGEDGGATSASTSDASSASAAPSATEAAPTELTAQDCLALSQFPPEVQVPEALAEKPEVTVPDAPAETLQSEDLVSGSGRPVQAGDCVVVNYVGVGQASGQEFDASFDRGQPFVFPLGAGAVIEGWDQGLTGATIGTRRKLVIPGDLAYGQGNPEGIQPDETLVFVVDVLGVAQPDGSVETAAAGTDASAEPVEPADPATSGSPTETAGSAEAETE